MAIIVGPGLDEIKDQAMERIVARVERKLMDKKFRRLGRFYNRPLPSVVTLALDQLDDEIEAAADVAEVKAIAKAFIQQHNL